MKVFPILRKFIFLLWSMLAVLVFFSSFETQLVVNDNLKRKLNIIFPEGWGFFTKNPRDLGLEVYKIENNKIRLLDASNHSYKNYFGLSRSARLVGYEASTVASEIQKNQWVKGNNSNLSHHLKDSTMVFSDKKYFNHLTKGEYLLKLYKPIPFAWANKNQEKYAPFSVAKIKIL